MDNLSQHILAYCLTNEDHLVRCVGELKPEYFEGQEAVIFEVLLKHHRKYNVCITATMLEEELEAKDLDVMEVQELVDLFVDLESSAVDPREFEPHMAKFKEEYTRRFMLEVFEGTVDESGKVVEGVASLASRDPKAAYDLFKSTIGIHMEELENQGIAQCQTVNETMAGFINKYKKLKSNPEEVYGVRMGFDFIDQITLGIHPGELFLIGGRPGSGKSIFLLNAAINAYKAGHKVLIVSIEMSYDMYQERFVASYCNIPFHELRTGRLTREQEQSLEKARKELEYDLTQGRYLEIADVTNVTAFTVEAEIKKIASKMGAEPDFVVIDYLGIMRSIDNQVQDWKELLAIAEEVRRLARVKKIPILSAVQLNRDKKKSKGTERIGRSDGIGQTCDVFLQIEEEDEEDEDNPIRLDDSLTIFIGKCRNGESNRSFQLYKNFANMVVKNKDVYKPRAAHELASMEDVGQDELGMPQEGPEDRAMQQGGEFISSD